MFVHDHPVGTRCTIFSLEAISNREATFLAFSEPLSIMYNNLL